MTVWPCGHPYTVANTQSVGKAGIRCRECRRKISLRHWRRKFKGGDAGDLEPVAAPTSGDVVPLGRTTLSRPSEGFAAAGDATVSNLVGTACALEAPTSANGPVTHRDLSQHADSYLTNGFEIVPHGEVL